MKYVVRNFGIVSALSLCAVVAACSQQSGSGSGQDPLGANDNNGGNTNVVSPECGQSDGGGGGCGQDSGPGGGSANSVLAVCDDAQVAAILTAIDTSEINESTAIAGSSSTGSANVSFDASIRDFAQRMITDHTAHRDAVKSLVTKLNISTQVTDALANEITKDSERDVTATSQMNTNEIETHYLNRQILGHLKALGVIDLLARSSDKTLCSGDTTGNQPPNTTPSDFKSFLAQTRVAVRQHLSMILAIQTKLEGACGVNGMVGCDDGGTMPQPPTSPTPMSR